MSLVLHEWAQGPQSLPLLGQDEKSMGVMAYIPK